MVITLPPQVGTPGSQDPELELINHLALAVCGSLTAVDCVVSLGELSLVVYTGHTSIEEKLPILFLRSKPLRSIQGYGLFFFNSQIQMFSLRSSHCDLPIQLLL